VTTSLPPTSEGLSAASSRAADRRVLESVFFFGLAIFASLLGILSAALAEVSAQEMLMIGVALVTILLALLPLAVNHSRAKENRHVLLMIFAVSFACFYAFPLFTQYFLGDPLREGNVRLNNLDPSNILAGQSVALTALVCVYAGYIYPIGRFAGELLPRPTFDWPHPTALFIAVVMIFMGWTVFMGSTVGIIPRSFGSGVLGAISSSMYFGIGLLMIIYLKYRSQPARTLMVVLVPFTMAIAFLTGSKRFALSPLIVIAIAHIVIERRIRARWVVGGALALIALYPIAQFWREVSWTGTLSLFQWMLDPARVIRLLGSYLAATSFAEYFEGGLIATGSRLDLLGITTVIVRDTPGVVPYQGGWTLAYIPISFIPRILWSGKPEFHIGQWVTDNFGAGPMVVSSTGSGWVGELYFNFGLIGVIAGMFFIGSLFRLLHETLFRSDGTIPALLAALVVIWTTCPTMEGNLLAPFSGGIFHLTPILLTHMAVRATGAAVRIKPQKARAPNPGTS